MNQKLFTALRTAFGFFLAGIPLSLYILSLLSIPSLRDSYYWPFLLILALGASGAIGAASLSDKQERHRSRLPNALGFSIGFVIGGSMVCLALLGLGMGVEEGSHYDSDIFLDFFWIYTVGFTTAGMLSAAMTRSRLLSVISGAFSFCVGGAVGGAIIGVIFKMDWQLGVKATLPGVIASYTVGGAICGLLSKTRESS